MPPDAPPVTDAKVDAGAPPAVVPPVTTPPVTPDAPAVVEYKFDPAEGFSPEFDGEVTKTAKALGWDLETAKKFRAHEMELAKAELASDALAATTAKTAEAQRITQEDASWEKKNREHADYGGAKYDETSIKIDKLLAEYDKSGEFAKHFAAVPRLKSEPSFRAFLASLAYAHGEGRFVQGSGNAPASGAATLQEMYHTMKR